MKHVNKSVLLWYSPREMYALVINVPEYPQFLPWCERAEVLERQAGGMTARLHLAYAGVRHAFTTRNEHVADASVRLGLVDGNLMTNLASTSDKLRQRALRIVMALSRCDEQRAAELLAACDGNVSEAVARAKT